MTNTIDLQEPGGHCDTNANTKDINDTKVTGPHTTTLLRHGVFVARHRLVACDEFSVTTFRWFIAPEGDETTASPFRLHRTTKRETYGGRKETERR
jgi:hypothetical protein